MLIVIDRSKPTPLYLQIKKEIRELILSRTLPAGFCLPPERKLAETLGVNRTTVVNAYNELKADGLIGGQVGRGTMVLPQSPGAAEPHQPPAALQWRQFFNEASFKGRDPLLRDLMELVSQKDVISFAAGIPDPGDYPLEVLAEIQREMIANHGADLLVHTPVEGHYPLRESICGLMESRGIHAAPEETLILSGSQQGLNLIARAFLKPGDVVLVEEPSFFCAIQVFQAAGARVFGVPTDERGMIVNALEPLLDRHQPKLIYTLPTFQNPSGAVMDLERRLHLLDLAYHYQIPIVEDDPYYEMRYEGEPVPPLKALDRYGYVLYLSTFSKLFFPGARIGWVAAPRPVIRQFTWEKQNVDLHSNNLGQWLFDGLLRRDFLPGHIRRVTANYRTRRDQLIAALERHAPAAVEWNHPPGGFYLWCRLPFTIDSSRLLATAVKQRVAFVPGTPFSTEGMGRNYLRLNFTFPAPEQLEPGVKRLVRAIRETLREAEELPGDPEVAVRPII
jgi:DNA-binding transcriptional MocR family regulator